MRNFMDKPNNTYLETVTVLRKLLEEQGLDVVTRAYAEATWETAREQYVSREGLKPAGDGHVCIHRLKGERCPNEECDSPTCIPEHDHSSEWKKDGKSHVIVSQPYHFSYETMKETIEFCDANGLRADISASPSWHFPGAVVTVEYKRSA
jgi:hypothetical protein